MKKLSLSIPEITTVLFLGGLAAAYALSPGLRHWLGEAYDVFATGDPQQIKNWLQGYRDIGPYILIGAFLVQMFLFVIPSVLVMSICILMYGEIWGSLLCVGGIFLASTIAFLIGKALSTFTVDKIIGKSSRQKMESFLENYGFWTIVIFRLSPFLSNDAVSLAGGLVKMNYGRFIAATLMGIIPLTVLLAWIGAHSQRLQTGLIIVSAIGLAGLIFYIYLNKKKKAASH